MEMVAIPRPESRSRYFFFFFFIISFILHLIYRLRLRRMGFVTSTGLSTPYPPRPCYVKRFHFRILTLPHSDKIFILTPHTGFIIGVHFVTTITLTPVSIVVHVHTFLWAPTIVNTASVTCRKGVIYIAKKGFWNPISNSSGLVFL